MREIQYRPTVGCHIQQACEAALSLSQQSQCKVVFRFNDVLMVATPRRMICWMRKEWERAMAQAGALYRRAPSTILRERAFAEKMRRAQREADKLIAFLPDILTCYQNNPRDVTALMGLVAWVEQLTPLAGWSAVTIPCESLLKQLQGAGFSADQYSGMAPDWYDTQERMALWIIGQAMDGFTRGMGPAPIIEKFCAQCLSFKESNHV